MLYFEDVLFKSLKSMCEYHFPSTFLQAPDSLYSQMNTFSCNFFIFSFKFSCLSMSKGFCFCLPATLVDQVERVANNMQIDPIISRLFKRTHLVFSLIKEISVYLNSRRGSISPDSIIYSFTRKSISTSTIFT